MMKNNNKRRRTDIELDDHWKGVMESNPGVVKQCEDNPFDVDCIVCHKRVKGQAAKCPNDW